MTDAGTTAGRAEDQEADLHARANALDDLLASVTPAGAAALSE